MGSCNNKRATQVTWRFKLTSTLDCDILNLPTVAL